MPRGLKEAAYASIGFTATIAQILLLRELMIVFSGNELSLGLLLAFWLLWTGVGATALGRWLREPMRANLWVGALQLLTASSLVADLCMVRGSRAYLQATPGTLLGLGPMIATSVGALALFCIPSGLLFAAASHLERKAELSAATATGRVYLCEALGSGAGGLLASLLFIPWLTPFQTTWIVLGVNAVLASCLLVTRLRKHVASVVTLGVFGSFWWVPGMLERATLGWSWRGFQIVAVRNSPYGQLVVAEAGGARSLFESGVRLFGVGEPEQAEDAVHYSLLQHPAPRRVLLLGGGLGGAVIEILKHPSVEHVDYVELDPELLRIARWYFPEEWRRIETDPRVRIHLVDGRIFLRRAGTSYDVVIVNMPEPQTAQLNRYYTLECFRELARRLAEGGVISIRLPASENYISDELAALLRALTKTLRQVFPEVTAIPGETVHLLASNSRGVLTRDPVQLVERLKKRQLNTIYVQEYYVPFRLMPDRLKMLDERIEPLPETPVNRDFEPIAYYFAIARWGKQFRGLAERLTSGLGQVSFEAVLVVSAIILLAGAVGLFGRRSIPSRVQAAVGYVVVMMGLTMMALEALLLLGFQALWGFVYEQLALIIALFMVGMAWGSHKALRWLSRDGVSVLQNGLRLLAGLALMASLAGMAVYSSLVALGDLSHPVWLFVATQLVFPLLALAAGFLGGYQFPVASAVYFSARWPTGLGVVYGLDLVGACAGAMLLGAFMIPLFGFLRTVLWLFGGNLAVAVMLYTTAFSRMGVASQ